MLEAVLRHHSLGSYPSNVGLAMFLCVNAVSILMLHPLFFFAKCVMYTHMPLFYNLCSINSELGRMFMFRVICESLEQWYVQYIHIYDFFIDSIAPAR